MSAALAESVVLVEWVELAAPAESAEWVGRAAEISGSTIRNIAVAHRTKIARLRIVSGAQREAIRFLDVRLAPGSRWADKAATCLAAGPPDRAWVIERAEVIAAVAEV